MIRIACPLAVVCALAGAAPAPAQDQVLPQVRPAEAGRYGTLTPVLPPDAGIYGTLTPVLPPDAVSSEPSQNAVASAFRRKLTRPAALIPLYASFATLQALDYASTTRALAGGRAREANPAMGAIVGNRAAFIAVKTAASAGVIFAGEKIWKKNRVAAVIFVAALNGAVAGIVARNYRVR